MPCEAPHPLSFYKLRCDGNRDRGTVGAPLGELPRVYAGIRAKEQAAFGAPEGSAWLLSGNYPNNPPPEAAATRASTAAS